MHRFCGGLGECLAWGRAVGYVITKGGLMVFDVPYGTIPI